MSLREEKKRRTREAILSVAKELFDLQGYDKTTVNEIAEKAHISRKTLFNYFPSKSHILQDLTWQWFSNDIFEGKGKPIDPAFAIIPQLLKKMDFRMHLIEQSRIFLLQVVEHTTMLSQINAITANEGVLKSNNQEITDILALAQQKGELRQDLDIRQMAHTFLTLRNAVIQSWLSMEQYEEGELQRRMNANITLLLEGLGLDYPK